jgi:hypothetical protein
MEVEEINYLYFVICNNFCLQVHFKFSAVDIVPIIYRRTGIVDTGGKFATVSTPLAKLGVVDTGGKFATSVVDTGGAQ